MIKKKFPAEPKPTGIDGAVASSAKLLKKKRPADVKPSGADGAVASSAKLLKKAAHERRTSDRFQIKMADSCRPAIGDADRRWVSAVLDISTTGLGMQVGRRFELGSVLEIAVANNPEDNSINLLARVRWLKADDGNAWLLGCAFVEKMTAEDLEMLFNAPLENTKVIKK